ncbi:hypothetical protein ABT392_04470 [Paucibacter sp. JuS9]|uniref:hypothetical protein n=1 Tax=Paucibacter sp. JuS9 TaxID=3228748 RepID=UPI00375760DD
MAVESSDQQGQDWLHGVAGAPAGGQETEAFAEGRRLRAGLDRLPEFDAPAEGWADVEQRARARPARAANDARWRWGAAAASLALAVGLALHWQPAPDPQWRGADGGEAQWRSTTPQADAQRLAAQLRGWGAQVDMQAATEAGGWSLDIQCASPCDGRVVARLAELETALPPKGGLRLLVLPRH